VTVVKDHASREAAGLEDLLRAADSAIDSVRAPEIRSETPHPTVVWKIYAALTALVVAFSSPYS
jgi:hypothetical protein